MGETEGTGASATVQGIVGEGLSQKTSGTAPGRPRSLGPAAVLDLADIV